MTVKDLTEEQRETIYQLFFCGRSITKESRSNKQYDNTIDTISEKTGISKFVINGYLDKCIIMRRELSIPISEEMDDEGIITATFKSRMNYEI